MYNKDKGAEKDLREMLQLGVCNEERWVWQFSTSTQQQLESEDYISFSPLTKLKQHCNWEALKKD